jgi:hypothetical protein
MMRRRKVAEMLVLIFRFAEAFFTIEFEPRGLNGKQAKRPSSARRSFQSHTGRRAR